MNPRPLPLEARALPRVGLLGNPSDLYGGAVIAFTFHGFRARVRLARAAGAGDAQSLAVDWPAAAALDPFTLEGLPRLAAAALRRLAARFPGARPEAGERIRLHAATDIPRQVGLAGSSAVIVASLRALAAWQGRELAPLELAELALAAETEELGIVAGPQDRVAQAFEGLVHMEFHETPWRVTELDPALLPPALVAWDPSPGRDSGAVHNDVRARWEAGDAEVRGVMAELGVLVAEGLECLRSGDHRRLRELVDANFDLRARIFPIDARHRRLVELGRAAGAGTKFCGSGGAVLCVVEEPDELARVEAAFSEAGFPALRVP